MQANLKKIVCASALAWTAMSMAADRQIGVDPMLSVHWSTLTGGPTTPAAQMGNHMMVGFWQRSSGAKAGVGSINTGVVEFQLPENPPQRIRSATLQFKARASQCSGAEPVVFEVFGYAGNGRPDPGDALSGGRLAQITANCPDNPAFTQVIDVSNLVRQLSVPSGLRFVGFNVRKMNHRAGPSYFGFSAAKLTIVVASEDLAIAPSAPMVGGAAGAPGGTAAPGGNTQLDANKVIAGLAGAAATILRGAGQQPAREQARNEAATAISNPTSTVPDSPSGPRGRTGACGAGCTPRRRRLPGTDGCCLRSVSRDRRSFGRRGVRHQCRHRRHPAGHVAGRSQARTAGPLAGDAH